MSDPSDLVTVGTHAASGGGAGVLVAALMRLFQSREAAAVRTELALLGQQVGALATAIEKQSSLGERVALAEQSLKALHGRVDDLANRRDASQQRRRKTDL